MFFVISERRVSSFCQTLVTNKPLVTNRPPITTMPLISRRQHNLCHPAGCALLLLGGPVHTRFVCT